MQKIERTITPPTQTQELLGNESDQNDNPLNDSTHSLHRLGVAQMHALKNELLSNRISQKWRERRTNGR